MGLTLRLGPFLAPDANLDGNALTFGLPSMTATLGFADALVRKVAEGDGFGCRVALVLHRCERAQRQVRPTPGTQGGRLVNEELPERVVGRVEATVVVDGFPEVDLDRVRAVLPRLRFAGSPLFPARPGRPIELKHFQTPAPAELLGGLPRGFVLLDRPDLAPPCFGAEAEIERLVAAVGWRVEFRLPDGTVVDDPERLDEKERAALRRRRVRDGRGWLVPVVRGYRALEPVATARPRSGARSPDVPHLFVEDAVGVGELVSVRRIARGESLPDGFFWRWRVEPDEGLFLVGTDPPPQHPHQAEDGPR
jgi:hypothetical protein